MRPADRPLPTGPSPVTTTTIPGIAKAPPTRPAAAPTESGVGSDSRLPERCSIKTESLTEQSRTQVAKESCSKMQRDEEREARLAKLRREHDEIAAEAEADSLDVNTSG